MTLDVSTIITLALTNIISGIFIGMGICIGAYFSLKRNMPKWIKEIMDEVKKLHIIEWAQGRKKT